MAKLGDMPQSVKQQLIGVASTFGELSLYLNASSFNNVLLLKKWQFVYTVLGRESKEYWRKRKKHYYGVERAKSFDPDRWRGEMNKDLLFRLMSDSNCVSAMKFFNYINHV